ncbi:MAG: hypothetical protein LBC82_02030 [Oscillospiraceae bacterium]|nr:hypothetical protein [Oscillospiraceae bacterium]
MTDDNKQTNLTAHIFYNENGDSFENLLTEGIKKANFKAIYKQITIVYDASEKEER